MTSTTTPSFPFPHTKLTPIVGKPTSATIKLLTRELYANARSVHSTHGGGNNGYLALCMTAASYLARAGQAFDIPNHPGAQPVHAAAATSAQITAVNQQYDQDLKDFTTYNAINESLRTQLLETVNPTFYDVLEDDTFGYADVTIVLLLTHLVTEYGTLTRTDLELNRNRLKAAWNPDDEFANLWTRIKTVRQIATDGGDPISDNTTMELTLEALRQSGVYAHALQTWDDKADDEQTYAAFRAHFTQQEKIRLRNITAKSAGFHSAANIAGQITPPPGATIIPPDYADAATAAITPAQRSATETRWTSNSKPLYYCWTHGLNQNPQHSSRLCKHKGEGHCNDATLENRKGGINKINFGRSGRPRGEPRE
jgi:hypothetical protein